MGEQKTQGGWAIPEPDFDPTSAPSPVQPPAEREPFVETVPEEASKPKTRKKAESTAEAAE